MIRKMVVTALFGLLFLVLVACNGAQPQVSLATTHLELGDVVNGTVVEREVVVANKGTEALIIESVSTSCGCTQATLDPMSIAPGEQGVLHIEFDSGAHGPELTGELIRQVFVVSNDPEQPEAVVELSANILAPSVP